MEGVTLIRTEGHKRRRHVPTMQVAAYVEVGVRPFLVRDIKAGTGAYLPSVSESDTAAQRYVMAQLEGVNHMLVVEVRLIFGIP